MAGFYELIGFCVSDNHQAPLSQLDLDPAVHAFFLDFDGVIADIAPRPDAVEVPASRQAIVRALREASGNAVALVSGREIADLRGHFPAYEGAISGGHGAETVYPDGRREDQGADEESLGEVVGAMEAYAATRDGLLFERKRLGATLHYRDDPSLEPAAWRMVETLIEGHPSLEIQPAKMAVEVKPQGFSKGSVIRAFMAEAPFEGRTPFYAGDDTTDEAAFRVVNEMNGVSVKVGEGPTCARYSVASPSRLFAWLGGQLRGGSAANDVAQRPLAH